MRSILSLQPLQLFLYLKYNMLKVYDRLNALQKHLYGVFKKLNGAIIEWGATENQPAAMSPKYNFSIEMSERAGP